jgi:hypothetical protein
VLLAWPWSGALAALDAARDVAAVGGAGAAAGFHRGPRDLHRAQPESTPAFDDFDESDGGDVGLHAATLAWNTPDIRGNAPAALALRPTGSDRAGDRPGPEQSPPLRC